MTRNKQLRCEICSKRMRSDNLKRHMKQHDNIPKYPMKECSICKKSMISWNLPRHFKTHSSSLQELLKGLRTDQSEYLEKGKIGEMVKDALENEEIDPNSLNKVNSKALETYTLSCKVRSFEKLNEWQEQVLSVMTPSERKIIWVTGVAGGEGKSWFQNYIEHYYGRKRVFRTSIHKNMEGFIHALSKRTLPLIDVFVFNIPRCFNMVDVPYSIFENIKDGRAISTKYDSRILDFKTPNIMIIFSNSACSWGKMSKDRWIKINLVKDSVNGGFIINKSCS